MTAQDCAFKHEVERGISIVTFAEGKLLDPGQIDRIKDGLYGLLDGGVDRLILDCQNVDFFGTTFLEMLIVLHKKLAAKKPFQPPCRRKWVFFEICCDRETALNVISRDESDPLVLCSVKPTLQEIFEVCSLHTEV